MVADIGSTRLNLHAGSCIAMLRSVGGVRITASQPIYFRSIRLCTNQLLCRQASFEEHAMFLARIYEKLCQNEFVIRLYSKTNLYILICFVLFCLFVCFCFFCFVFVFVCLFVCFVFCF